MAKAAVTIKGREIVGDDIAVTMHVTFFGTDLGASDSCLVTVRLGGNDTPATWRQQRNGAITAEAQRLGITWNGKIVSDADLLRDA
jgi:hypothetical protein